MTYEYTDSLEKLEEKAFPSKEGFFNTLTETNVTNYNYKHAQNV